MRIETKEVPTATVEPNESPITSLALIEETSAALVYAPGAITALVDRIKEEVRGQMVGLDVSIDKDKKRYISLSAKVASAKAKLDKMGESLIEEHRSVVNAVNADRKAMRDELDAFKIEVRKPVTELEQREDARKAAHEAALLAISESAQFGTLETSAELNQRLYYLRNYPVRDWQEFKTRADKAISDEILRTEGLLARAQKQEADRAEAKRLDDEVRERAIKEREAAAAKAAKEEAERKAAERARIVREAAEAEQRRIENERIQAEARAKQIEAQRVADAEKAARELREAEERRVREAAAAKQREEEAAAQAKRDQEAAIEEERQRVAAEKKHELEEAEKRAKNRAHLAAINREVLGALETVGVPDELGKAIIAAIVKGEIPHVTIAY